MKTRKPRWISWLLVFAMCINALPIATLSAQAAAPVARAYDDQELIGEYATLQEAFDALIDRPCQKEFHIDLLSDVEESVTVNMTVNNIRVELEGYRWRGVKASEDAPKTAMIVKSGKVSIRDYSGNGKVSGKVISDGGRIGINAGWWSLGNLVKQSEPPKGKAFEIKGGYFKADELDGVRLADYLANSSYHIVQLEEAIDHGGDDIYTCMVEQIPVGYQVWNGTDYEPGNVLFSYSRVDKNEPWYKAWYAVNEGEQITVGESVTVSGDVNVVLCDGASLTVDGGITVENGSLRIYGQGAGLQVCGGSSADDLAPLPRMGDGNEYDFTGCAYIRIEQAAAPAEIEAFAIVDGVVEINVFTPEAATAFFACYDNNGRFIGVEQQAIAADENAHLSYHVTSDTRIAKLMLMGATGNPLCPSQSAERHPS